MRFYILTITLNPAIDKTVVIPKFKIGHDFREKALSVSAGGKGINVSRVLSRLKCPTVAGGFLGGPNGDYINNHLKRENIKSAFSPVSRNTRTSLTIIDPTSGKITRVLERGPMVNKKELNVFRKHYCALLARASCVVISGRNIPGAPSSFYATLIRIAAKRKLFTLLDTSGQPYHEGLKSQPCMIKPNLAECEQVLGKKVKSLEMIKWAAQRLYQRGIRTVAITMGSQGALVYNGEKMLLVKPPKVQGKNPVGCGDAFIAGFLASRRKGETFEKSARLAVACGTANVLSINPGHIAPLILHQIQKAITTRTL